MTGAGILERQGHEHALRLLAAQRHLYRDAKHVLALQILLVVILPGVLSAVALGYPGTRPWAAIGALAVLVLDVLIWEPRLRTKRQQAASIQEEFDCLVFDLEWPLWRLAHRPEPELIQEASTSLLAKPNEISVLRDWFPPAIGRLSDLRAVLVCQRFSILYGLRVRRPVAAMLLILVVTTILSLLAGALYWHISLPDALLGLAVPAYPMLNWTWRELIRQREQVATHERIKGAIEKTIAEVSAYSLTETSAQIRVRHLQTEILNARLGDPLIFDWIYRILRPKNEKTMIAAAEIYVDAIEKLASSSSLRGQGLQLSHRASFRTSSDS